MSTITDISNNINESFPVPGQDNDSQGFRDNFNNTKLAFSQADVEISDLQNKVLLKQQLGGSSAVDNDLQGSTINNGSYNNFYGVKGSPDANNSIFVDEASFCLCELDGGDTNYTFRNWPESGVYGIIRVQFKGPLNTASKPVLFTSDGGDIIKSLDFPTNLAVSLAKATSGTQSANQNELVLTNATDLAIGMVVTGTNIPGPDSTPVAPLTTITDIDGETVTLSQNISETINDNTNIYFSYPNGRVIEAWSFNSGATVYVKHIGDF